MYKLFTFTKYILYKKKANEFLKFPSKFIMKISSSMKKIKLINSPKFTEEKLQRPD